MTIDEMLARESIRATMVSYNVAGDRLQAAGMMAVFTEDGILESDGVPQADAFRYEGRKAIGEWISRWHRSGAADAVSSRASFVRHHLSTCHIELTGADSAKARTYWTAYTDIGPDHCGYYVDSFRKVGERWLIAHRKVRLDWRSPQSLFTTAVAETRGQ
jgi:3-phenylpropionate/cinnamic acid dioxygenase small subunit